MDKKSHIFFFIISVLVVLGVFFHPFTAAFKIEDFATKVFHLLNKADFQADEIVVVEIDDKSLKKISEQWPFKRSVYAKALDILRVNKAKVIGFDLAFVGDGASAEDDQAFAEAIGLLGEKVVLAYFLDAQANPVYPKEEFRENSLTGFINVPVSSDSFIRKTRAYYSRDDFFDFSWSFKIAAAFYGQPLSLKGNTAFVDSHKIVLDPYGTMNVNYLLSPDKTKSISFIDLLSGDFSPGFFAEKIVLISPTLRIVHDIHHTPIGYIPGIFIQANVIAGILRDKPLYDLPLVVSILILISGMALIAGIAARISFLKGLAISLGILVVLFWLDLGFKYFGWQFAYGKVVLSCLTFLVLLNLYRYAAFLVNIWKLKNHMIIDPLTNLYNMRYFIERLNFESVGISARTNYLLMVKIEGFESFSRAENFESLKRFWQDLVLVFFGISRLWSRYDTEMIIGRVSKAKDAQKLEKALAESFFSRNVKVKIKIASLQLKHGRDIRNLLTPLAEKLGQSQNQISSFKSEDFPLSKENVSGTGDLFSALSLDAQDKNRQLLDSIKQIKAQEQKTQDAYLELVAALVTALESKDPYTQGHTKRVCDYSMMLAEKLDLDPEEKKKIKRAALLHDLGKIGIPDAILHKKGKLTDEEFAVIKEHEVLSAQILEPIKEFGEVIPYVMHHHEAFDGSGYPHGLAGEFIPFGARLISVADIFDALTTGRDYKKAFSVKDSVEELEKIKGTKLDPVLVDKFIEALKDSRIL